MADHQILDEWERLTPAAKQEVLNTLQAQDLANAARYGVIGTTIPEIGPLEALWDVLRGKVFRYDLYPQSMSLPKLWKSELKRLFETLVWQNDPNKSRADNFADNAFNWGTAYAYPWGTWAKWVFKKTGIPRILESLIDRAYQEAAYDQVVRRYPFIAASPKNKYGLAHVQPRSGSPIVPDYESLDSTVSSAALPERTSDLALQELLDTLSNLKRGD